MSQVKRSGVVLEEDYPLNFVTYFYVANSQDNLVENYKEMESLEIEALITSISSCFLRLSFFPNSKRLFPKYGFFFLTFK